MSRVEIRVRVEGGAQDVSEKLFGVGVFESAAVGTRYGCAEGGEDADVGGVFAEDFEEAFAYWPWHFGERERSACSCL